MRISDWSSDVCSSDLVFGSIVLWLLWVLIYAYTADFWGNTDIRNLGLAWIKFSAPQYYLGLLALLVAVFVVRQAYHLSGLERSEERRVGKECVSTFRSRWWPVH